jgi:hypothetical protein
MARLIACSLLRACRDVVATCLMLLVVLGSTAAHSRSTDDFKTAAIKVAFVYNFAKFTTWPPDRFRSPSEPMRFCVQRGDLDPEALRALEQKQVGDRLVRIETMNPGAAIGGCHILFASGFQSEPSLRALLVAATLNGVLLVSNMPGFAVLGGHIGLVEDSNRLRFQVNLDATLKTGLKLSSKFLQLAEIVGPVTQ